MTHIEARKLPEVCNGCPTSRVAKLIGDFWMMLIVRSLLQGPKRFNELKLTLEGVSSRTLVLKLELAQSAGIIERHEYAEAPPRVEYSLTEKGRALKGIVRAVEKFAEEYA